jgi:hypothetical protein
MTLQTSRQRYTSPIREEMNRLVESTPGKQIKYALLGELVRDLVKDYRGLRRHYQVHPVLMHSMIPVPSDRLHGKPFTSETSFVRWLAEGGDTLREAYCSPLKTQKHLTPKIVDFEEAWPLCYENSRLTRILLELGAVK